MSTHIPADYFTKPILADLGVGKVPGCNGWIKGQPWLRETRNYVTEQLRGEWVTPVYWDHGGLGLDNGVTRAFCGCVAPTADVSQYVEGPLGEHTAVPYVRERAAMAYGVPFAVAASIDSGHARLTLAAKFPGERTQGYVRRESEVERWARVAVLFRSVTGLDPPTDIPVATRLKQWPEWVKWTAEHEEQLRPRWSLHLPGRVNEAGELLPDMGLIDCPKCLAAWDRFSEHTGAQVVLAEVVSHGDAEAYSDEETWGADAGDRGGRW